MEVRVCDGKVCRERLSKFVMKRLESDVEKFGFGNDVNLEFCGCVGRCKKGPNVVIDGAICENMDPVRASKEFFRRKKK